MRAFLIHTPAFDEAYHIVHAENANKAKWKIGTAIYETGFERSIFNAIRRYIVECKRAPRYDGMDPASIPKFGHTRPS